MTASVEYTILEAPLCGQASSDCETLSCMTESIRQPAVAAIVLAAGMSSRFGATKLTAPVLGRPLVQHALLAAREACPGQVHLVLGHAQDAIDAACDNLYDRKIINENYADGIGTSIAAGVSACHEEFDAVLILLADQAMITGAHLRSLIDGWSESGADIVVSSFAETFGPPILFALPTLDALCRLRGDQGARRIVESGKFKVEKVRCEAASVDIDTPGDLDALAQR